MKKMISVILAVCFVGIPILTIQTFADKKQEESEYILGISSNYSDILQKNPAFYEPEPLLPPVPQIQTRATTVRPQNFQELKRYIESSKYDLDIILEGKVYEFENVIHNPNDIIVRVTGSSNTELQMKLEAGENTRFFDFSNASVVIDTVQFTGFANNNGGISAKDVYIDNCIFINNKNVDGGAIYAEGTVQINRSYFSGNLATQNGGAVSVQGDTTKPVKILHSNFDNNSRVSSTGMYGGAVNIQKSSVVDIFGCRFSNNTNKGSEQGGGGAVAIGDIDSVSISNSVFHNNSTWNSGGGLYLERCGQYDGTAPNAKWNILWYNTFVDNQAAYGGAIASENTGKQITYIARTMFAENKSMNEASGSAYYSHGGATCLTYIKYNTFIKNSIGRRAEQSGGIHLEYNLALETADPAGGSGIWWYKGKINEYINYNKQELLKNMGARLTRSTGGATVNASQRLTLDGIPVGTYSDVGTNNRTVYTDIKYTIQAYDMDTKQKLKEVQKTGTVGEKIWAETAAQQLTSDLPGYTYRVGEANFQVLENNTTENVIKIYFSPIASDIKIDKLRDTPFSVMAHSTNKIMIARYTVLRDGATIDSGNMLMLSDSMCYLELSNTAVQIQDEIIIFVLDTKGSKEEKFLK